jgi:hypothetical protein
MIMHYVNIVTIYLYWQYTNREYYKSIAKDERLGISCNSILSVNVYWILSTVSRRPYNEHNRIAYIIEHILLAISRRPHVCLPNPAVVTWTRSRIICRANALWFPFSIVLFSHDQTFVLFFCFSLYYPISSLFLSYQFQSIVSSNVIIIGRLSSKANVFDFRHHAATDIYNIRT